MKGDENVKVTLKCDSNITEYMNTKERRSYIKKLFSTSNNTHKGQDLAQQLGVTRQVIVKDIAILRAEGLNIVATPDGYMTIDNINGTRKIIFVCHSKEQIQDEFNIILKFGGTIEDVIVEHPLYGEIKGMLMIKNHFDMENFMVKFNEIDAQPLCGLTQGLHLHTIRTDTDEEMNNILNELKNSNYLINE